MSSFDFLLIKRPGRAGCNQKQEFEDYEINYLQSHSKEGEGVSVHVFWIGFWTISWTRQTGLTGQHGLRAGRTPCERLSNCSTTGSTNLCLTCKSKHLKILQPSHVFYDEAQKRQTIETDNGPKQRLDAADSIGTTSGLTVPQPAVPPSASAPTLTSANGHICTLITS